VEAATGDGIALLVAALVLVAGAGVEIVAYFDQVIPNETEWAGLGQADAEAEAFVYWDDDGYISTRCAKCHSTLGHLDFLGVEGTDANVVDNAAPLGMTVECIACHNEARAAKDSMVFQHSNGFPTL